MRALDLLVCPACKSGLALTVHSQDNTDIMEGLLSCGACHLAYPIRRGVPRFVDDGAYAASFGYQWNRFWDVQLDSRNGTSQSATTLDGTIGWRPKDYAGRLVLDAGVGAGRFAEIVAARGAEVVGIDLTEAVDAAFRHFGQLDNVHLIQADIFSMPFRNETFDLAYSIGVIYHTRDPREAFARVAATVKKGGGLAIYLYAAYWIGNHFSDIMRSITTRLPTRVMVGLAALAVPLLRPPTAFRSLDRCSSRSVPSRCIQTGVGAGSTPLTGTARGINGSSSTPRSFAGSARTGSSTSRCSMRQSPCAELRRRETEPGSDGTRRISGMVAPDGARVSGGPARQATALCGQPGRLLGADGLHLHPAPCASGHVPRSGALPHRPLAAAVAAGAHVFLVLPPGGRSSC